MIVRLVCLALLLCHSVQAGVALDFKRVHTSEDLAKYMFSLETNSGALSALPSGLDSTNSIQPSPYSTPIPVREICGTVVEARFGNELGSTFFEKRKYGLREICAFRDKDGEICRYHIVIYEERQYHLMKDLLRKKLRMTPHKITAANGGQARHR